MSLRDEIIAAVRRLPYHSAILYQTAEKLNSVLVIEGADGVQEAVRSALELEIPLRFVDPSSFRHPQLQHRVADAYLLDLLGQETFLKRVGLQEEVADDEDRVRESFMAARLQEAEHEFGSALFVGGLHRIPRLARLIRTPQAIPLMKLGVTTAAIAPLHPDSLKRGFTEIPRITEAFERWREAPSSEGLINRHDLIIRLMMECAAYYERETHEQVSEQVKVGWFRFLRKLLRYKGELLPDLYYLVASARAAFDEDFAYHAHEYLSDYSWANDAFDPAAALLDEDALMFHGHKIVLHKKLRTLFGHTRKYRMKAVQHGKWKEHLKRKWEAAAPNEVDICSYPPEDVQVEKWGAELVRHAAHILQASQYEVEPFTTDMGEGPDVRETLRRFYERRIYVKTREPGGLEFGSVVVIFDEDEDGKAYPFQMTWLGEFSQESDMAFYSTPPGVRVVGPGISRMEHGAFMLSYPPLRMYDVWSDPAFDFAPTRHELLLIAGIAYSEKPGIAYTARRPPAARWKRLAKSMGKRLVYIPLGSLNPLHVKRMRTFHMLQNKGVRNYAHEYLKPLD
jgi:hypothetical protein